MANNQQSLLVFNNNTPRDFNPRVIENSNIDPSYRLFKNPNSHFVPIQNRYGAVSPTQLWMKEQDAAKTLLTFPSLHGAQRVMQLTKEKVQNMDNQAAFILNSMKEPVPEARDPSPEPEDLEVENIYNNRNNPPPAGNALINALWNN